jgi:hypothetical protein
MKRATKLLTASVIACSLMINGASAYNADANIGPDFNNTLFSAGTTPAPLNTIVWFVASTDANLGTFGLNTVLTPDQLLGADDTILVQAKVDGGSGGGPGYLVETYSGIDISNSPKNIFVLLFGNQTAGGTPNLTPVGGELFGFASLGVRANPAFGNADWSPLGSIVGNTHQIVAVPEPATYLLSMLGVAGLIGYRRFRK